MYEEQTEDASTVGVYSIYDVKSELWAPPITFESIDHLNQFLDLVVNTHGTGDYHVYPEDYVVYQLGEFNEETGNLDLFSEKQFAVNMVGLKRSCRDCERLDKIAEDQKNESEQIQQSSAGESSAQ